MNTIRDVARLAGVSTTTVSRVINGVEGVSEARRRRVELAVADLDYVPNAVARHLRSKRTRTIAVVLSDITNPFFTTIARGIQDVAWPRGYAVTFANTDESETQERDYLRTLVQRQVDGVLLVPTGNAAEPYRLLRSQRIPVVLLDRHVSVRQLDEVRCDSEAGAYALVRHLIGLGHRRIAVVTGRRDISTSTDRVAGYERALASAELPLDRDLIRYDSFSLAGGYRMLKSILAIEPRPTAVLATNNFIAFGALRALREAGIDVPGDMSLVTFDDLPEEWHDDPFLTVLAQPAYELGRQAAELLFERLETGARGKRRVIVLPGAVIPRRSSAAPPNVVSDVTVGRRPVPA
ncbi:MAG: LacI family DNA-binding transcriptional regulator [Chloroflexi bacterium]|nr:LacI family DNA-binding transcriptional regulator [Chloroflexota bacterium]